MNKRTYVGLDVHARSVKGCAIDCETGEIVRQSLAANDTGTVGWVSGLPGPVLVVYEAGPTGFGLARCLNAAGMECVVAAPSKLQRPSGDRIKTDARDAERGPTPRHGPGRSSSTGTRSPGGLALFESIPSAVRLNGPHWRGLQTRRRWAGAPLPHRQLLRKVLCRTESGSGQQ
jgi:hypothetical protein